MVDAEAIEAEPPEPAAVEAFAVPGALDPLDEGEPYIPDEGDLHGSPDIDGGPRPSREELDAVLDEGSGVELPPAFGDAPTGEVAPHQPSQLPEVAPLPLVEPRAAPVHPVDLRELQMRPIEPVDLDEVTVEPVEADEEFPGWDPHER